MNQQAKLPFLPEEVSKVTLEYFSQAKTLMLLAAQKHPVLVKQCAHFNQRTQWPEMVGEIAAYCNVHMDGSYVPHELEALYSMLEERLSRMPVLLVMPEVADFDFEDYELKPEDKKIIL
jgi:hypothetical protein